MSPPGPATWSRLLLLLLPVLLVTRAQNDEGSRCESRVQHATRSLRERLSGLEAEVRRLHHALTTERNNIMPGLEMAELGGRRYYFSDERLQLKWRDAALLCRKLGLQLVAVEDSAENQRLKQHLLRNQLRPQPGFWLGGKSLSAGSLVWQGSWPWRPALFSDWHADEPSDDDGRQTCLVMWGRGENVHWGLTFCAEQERRFICEARD